MKEEEKHDDEGRERREGIVDKIVEEEPDRWREEMKEK
jgi:hypothetical protein